MLGPLFRRLSAAIVLLTMAGGVVMPLFGDLHAETNDPCAENTWGGGTPHHQTTQIESVRPPVSGDHCAVCHLQRAMSGADDDAKRFVQGEGPTPWIVRTAVRAPRELARHDVPSRAPPTFFL